jgi:DNA-binding NtrC family response regulator
MQVPPSANMGEGSETVLLVEDEAIVRELVGDILRAHGYHVLESGEPEAALRLAAAYEAQIDLLLTDVVMPQMDGRKLAEQLTTLRPELKVLYMSGYTESVIAPQDAAGRVIAFLQKPFTIDGLLQKVRSVLG